LPPPSSPPPPRPPSWTDDDRALRDRADGSAPASIVLEEGTLLARKYRLDRTAGFGGMAQLWVATNEATGAEVCVKILVPESIDDDSVQRFRREAYAAARLSHRAIVRIFDLVELNAAGEDTATKPCALAIVMELLRGETLGDYLMKKGKLSLEESIDLALPILSALAHAHRAGIIHRDLKPDNIFLATDPDGHVIPKVLDFGVSKVAVSEKTSRASAPLTLDGVMLGTPSYMSPEQARGARDVDARSDVFSASILVYMMLAGKNPFESETFHSVITAIMEREPPRLPGVPDAIWTVLEKGLAKDAAARYADATELGIALRRACGRAAATESGVHAVALPASERKLVVPLGGDSHVSVPPVGHGGDTASNAPLPGMNPPARKLAVRIVAAVVAASAALTTVALLRDPPGSSASAPASATGEIPRVASSMPRPAPDPTTTGSPSATAIATAATAAVTATTAPAVVADAGALRTAPTSTATQGTKKVVPSPTAAPLAAPSGLKEPALVRDPGF
jgi:serine/threonine-protein kinase